MIGHGLLASITLAAGRDNVICCIPASANRRYLVFTLKFYVGLSTIGALVMVLIKYLVPLFNGQGIWQAFTTSTTATFVIVPSLWIGATVIALILKQAIPIRLIVFLAVFSCPLYTFGGFIPGSFKFLDALWILFSSFLLLCGMLFFVFRLILGCIAFLASVPAIILFYFSAHRTLNKCGIAKVYLSIASLTEPILKGLSVLIASFTKNSLSHNPCHYKSSIPIGQL